MARSTFAIWNRNITLPLPRDEGFETLAGFVLAQLQKIPAVGRQLRVRRPALHCRGHGRPPRGEREDRARAAATAHRHGNATGPLMPLPALATAVHAAGGLAGRVGGLPPDSSGARRSHPADAGRRSGRHRYCRGAPCLRAGCSAGAAIRELLARPRARRHGTLAAPQSECRPCDRPSLSRDHGAHAGGADRGAGALDSRRRALGPAPQSLGRSGCSASSRCWDCRFPTSRWGRSSSCFLRSNWAGCQSRAPARRRTWCFPPSPWAERWRPS